MLEYLEARVDKFITDLGIVKNHLFEWTAEQVDRVVKATNARFTIEVIGYRDRMSLQHIR